jgi:hypothetical protein
MPVRGRKTEFLRDRLLNLEISYGYFDPVSFRISKILPYIEAENLVPNLNPRPRAGDDHSWWENQDPQKRFNPLVPAP